MFAAEAYHELANKERKDLAVLPGNLQAVKETHAKHALVREENAADRAQAGKKI